MTGNSAGPSGGSYQLRVPPAMEALQSELRNHPSLMAEMKLENAAGNLKTFEDGLAIIAAYVDVVLHGVYGAGEINDLCTTLFNKLVEKRQPLA